MHNYLVTGTAVFVAVFMGSFSPGAFEIKQTEIKDDTKLVAWDFTRENLLSDTVLESENISQETVLSDTGLETEDVTKETVLSDTGLETEGVTQETVLSDTGVETEYVTPETVLSVTGLETEYVTPKTVLSVTGLETEDDTPENGKDTFHYESCSTTQLVNLNSVSIVPDPVQIPGTLVINVDGFLEKELDSPIKADLEIEYKLLNLMWIKIPCINGTGSCSYDDICKQLNDMKCPAGFDCKCPIEKRIIKLVNLSMSLDEGFAKVDGDLRVTGTLYQDGKVASCYKFYFRIENKRSYAFSLGHSSLNP